MNTSTIVQKLWNYCNVMRDDGMSYGDHVEQPTYLLFSAGRFASRLLRRHEPSLKPLNCSFLKMADELFDHHRHTLEAQLDAKHKCVERPRHSTPSKATYSAN